MQSSIAPLGPELVSFAYRSPGISVVFTAVQVVDSLSLLLEWLLVPSLDTHLAFV